MKHGRMGRFRAEEHLLPVGVGLVAVFWIVDSVLDVFVFGEGNLPGAFLPTQPAQMWDRGLLAVVVLVFIGYAQRSVRARRREGELRSLMGSIAESSDEAIIGKTLKGIMTSWNRGAQSIYGYSAEEALGRPISMLVPPDRPNEVPAILERVRRGESVNHYETERVRRDGNLIHVSITVSPIRDPDGEIVGASIIARDVTERKRMEEALRESEQRLKSSFENAPIGMALVGTDGRWLQVNRALCEIVGYTEEELLEKTFQDITHPDDLAADLGYVQQLLAGEIGNYQMEKRYLHRLGYVVCILLSVSLVRDEGGEPLYLIAQIQDITERKRAEAEIRRLNESLEEQVAERTAQLIDRERRLKDLVGKLVAAQEEERRRVAYEVHDGPTQVAIAAHQHLQAFADDHPPGSTVEPGELDRSLELAQRAVVEARHIIEGLRPKALDDFGLSAAVRMRVEELKDEGWEIGHEDALGGERLPDEIETTLYRIAQEALANVRKHARTTRARTKLVCRGSKVLLEVRDEGRGFDPSSTAREGSPGERVGLSSMRERVAMLGGELKITSRPGAGTSLVAEVPLPGFEGDRP